MKRRPICPEHGALLERRRGQLGGAGAAVFWILDLEVWILSYRNGHRGSLWELPNFLSFNVTNKLKETRKKFSARIVYINIWTDVSVISYVDYLLLIPHSPNFHRSSNELPFDSHGLKFREWLCCGCDSECLIILRQDFGEGCCDFKT